MAFLRAITLPGKTSNRYKVPFPSGPYNLGGGGGGGGGEGSECLCKSVLTCMELEASSWDLRLSYAEIDRCLLFITQQK